MKHGVCVLGVCACSCTSQVTRSRRLPTSHRCRIYGASVCAEIGAFATWLPTLAWQHDTGRGCCFRLSKLPRMAPFPALRFLDVSNNTLTKLPPMNTLRSLEVLRAAHNRLSAIPDLKHCSRLKVCMLPWCSQCCAECNQ